MNTEKSDVTFTAEGIFNDLIKWIDYRLNLVDDPKEAGELLYNEFGNLKEMAETNLSVIDEEAGRAASAVNALVSWLYNGKAKYTERQVVAIICVKFMLGLITGISFMAVFSNIF